MPRHAKTIPQGSAAAEHLSAGILALCFPMAAINAIIAECKCAAQRERDLPPAVMVFFVIGMSLFPDVGYQSALRWLLNGLQWLGNADFTVCVKSSLAAARKRLGPDPLRRIHEQLAKPLAVRFWIPRWPTRKNSSPFTRSAGRLNSPSRRARPSYEKERSPCAASCRN